MMMMFREPCGVLEHLVLYPNVVIVEVIAFCSSECSRATPHRTCFVMALCYSTSVAVARQAPACLGWPADSDLIKLLRV